MTARMENTAWRELVASGIGINEMARLTAVNDFFNRFYYVPDDRHHGRDYWATPAEFMESGGGDCEDFAIAKYFALLDMGADASHLFLTYCRLPATGQAHMVLVYWSKGDQPLVLDNFMPQVLSASYRPDILPVYCFNKTQGFLLTPQWGIAHPLDVQQLSKWQMVLGKV
ncbi:MAG: transglutaminase-like cysteine peptidase [Desulfobulbaceae bacterium]|nr:transglutaminase-like cysteine peptidase [Desulfobulbaceae bacterium]